MKINNLEQMLLNRLFQENGILIFSSELVERFIVEARIYTDNKVKVEFWKCNKTKLFENRSFNSTVIKVLHNNGKIKASYHFCIEDGYITSLEGKSLGHTWPEKVTTSEISEV